MDKALIQAKTIVDLQTKNCPDCDTLPGQHHLDGCDVEHCSVCGGQRLQCMCGGHDPLFARWTGFWPGKLEAIALDITLNDVVMTDLYRFLFIKPGWE